MRMLIVWAVLCSTSSFAGFEQTSVSARAKALGDSYVGLADDAWSIFFNPGGTASITHLEVSFLYTPEQFGMQELSYAACAVALPTKLGVVSIAARRFGFELYREFTGAISYARSVSDVGAGITVNYHTVTIHHYGSAGTLGIDAGLKVNILDRLGWGIAAKNINSPTIGESREPLPQIFSSGISYHPVEEMVLTFEYLKELGFDSSPRFGVEYWLAPQFVLRTGVTEQPTQYAGGIGMKFSAFQLDYAFSAHQDLGWTHEASLTIRWGE